MDISQNQPVNTYSNVSQTASDLPPAPGQTPASPWQTGRDYAWPSNQLADPNQGQMQSILNTLIETVVNAVVTAVQNSLGQPSGEVPTDVPGREIQGQEAGSPQSESQEFDLEETLRQVLVPDEKGFVHEEQLQFAVVSTLLANENPEAAQGYRDAFEQLMNQGAPVEDAVKLVLVETVNQGILSQEQAEAINGISFLAAQLDDNHEALYDNIGSPGDPTVAVAPLEQAIQSALSVLDAVKQGQLEALSRPLDAPSNQLPSRA